MDKSSEMVSSESSKSIRISQLDNANAAKSNSTLSNKSDFKRAELNKEKTLGLKEIDTHSSIFLLHNKYHYGQKEKSRLIAVTLDTIESLSLETSIYISAIREKSKSTDSTGSVSSHVSTNHDLALLSVGDRIVSINGFSLANKSLLEISDLLANFEQFNMVIEKKSHQMSMSSLTLSKSLMSVDSSKTMSEKQASVRKGESRPTSTCDEELSKKKTKERVKDEHVRSSFKANRFKYPLDRFHVPPIYAPNHQQHGSPSTSSTSDEEQQARQQRFDKEKRNYELDELIKNFRQCNKERNLMDKNWFYLFIYFYDLLLFEFK